MAPKNDRNCRRRACAYAVLFAALSTPALAQVAPAASEPEPSQQPPAAAAPAVVATTENRPAVALPTSEETVVMSPFEVQAEARGYYAENTMSGTRLNTKLDDLASSISVVTKEQMEDFAALDINDVFLYEAGTEGLGTYTDFSFDRNGYPTDNSSLAPQSSNRIRGLTSANTAFGNFQTSGRVPIDPIITDSVEISRGPNANIFGLGNAGGTVNIVPASANLNRNTTQVEFRADSYEGWRTSLSLNRVLKKNVLAVRASGVFQHTGYVRKPSGTNTARLDGMIKYKPFQYTTLTFFAEDYRIVGTMPNLTMPRDEVSSWVAAGKPLWNTLTNRIVLNGVPSTGTYSMSTLPSYFINTTGTGRTNSTAFVEANGNISWWGPAQATTTAGLPSALNKNIFFVNTNSGLYGSTQPLFTSDPSLKDDSIYDWHHINLASMNYLSEATQTQDIGLEQFFLNTPRQVLALQLGFYHENSDKYRRDLAGGPTSQKFVGGLYIDPNMYMPDGEVNPDVGRPFIGLWNPRSYIAPLDNKNYRAQLAYRLDFRRDSRWWKWFGMQQVSAYMEYKDFQTRQLTYDDVIIDNHAWIPPGTQRGPTAGAITNNYFRFYVGDPGTYVNYGPHSFKWGTATYSYGPALNNAPVTRELATLGPGILSGSGNSNNRQILKTQGVILQSYLLDDRIVTTLGIRRDSNYNRAGTPLVILPDGYNVDMNAFNQWSTGDWSHDAGNTKTAGIVVKPLRWLNFNANFSNSFLPATPGTNLFLQPVPDPTGQGHDVGFTANLFNGKLMMRYDHYKTTQVNARDGQSTTLAQRVIGMDLDTANRASTPFNLATQATTWVTTQHPNYTTDQVKAAVADILKIDPIYITDDIGNNGRLVETDDVIAKGDEFELFLNATNYWNVKLNVTRQESINGQMADDINNYINARMPVWTSIKDPLTGLDWYTAPYDASGRSAVTFLQSSVIAPLKVAQAMRNKSRPEIREWHVNLLTSFRLSGITESPFFKRLQIGGAVRWESKGAIGYYGVQQLPDVITDLDPNRPIYDKAHAYFDAFLTYRVKLFANRVNTTFQFNVRNLQESGRLQPIQAYPDGTASGYRIVDPRQFIFTVKFDL